MSLELLALFLILALAAEILGTIGGFGSSLLFVPLAGLFLDLHSVLGITALFHVASNLSKITLFRSGFDKNLILYLGIPAVLFVILGAWVSKYVNPFWLEASLSVFLLVISGLFLIKSDLKLEASNRNALLGGSLSGFAAGLLGTGGAIRGLTMASFQLPMTVFIATSAFIDLLIDVSRSVVYLANGYVHTHDFVLVVMLLVVSFAGTWIGKQILNKISETRFRKIVLWLILSTGIFTLIKLMV